MVGLGVRDASGALRGRDQANPGFARLRVDLPLQSGYTVTAEPGIYFIPAMLAGQTTREHLAQRVDWDRLDQVLDFGGIRLEGNLLNDEGSEVLTAHIPLLR